jgi:UDP-2,3-diacylglucosamine hydrolase
MGEKLGIIAGNGKFPLILAENARTAGLEVVAVAFRDETDTAIERLAAKTYWQSITQLGKAIKTFKDEGVEKAVMAGQIAKRRMYTSDIARLDLTFARLWFSLPNRRGDVILAAIADEFAKNGIEVIDSTLYMGPSLATRGVMTRKKPSDKEMSDVKFGYEMAKAVAEHDIGQSVVVKDLSVVAVEAVEGTDACIRRGGELGKKGVVVVKVSRRGHDMRFDVPTVGLGTLETLKDASVSVLAVEAGKTIMLEKDKFISGADAAGICVLGI